MTAITHDAATEATLAVVRRFNEESFQRHDVDALMADMTDDCVFELVAPAEKGGGRWEGQAAVRAFWASLEATFPGYASDIDDIFACGDRCACRWTPPCRLPRSACTSSPDAPGPAPAGRTFRRRVRPPRAPPNYS